MHTKNKGLVTVWHIGSVHTCVCVCVLIMHRVLRENIKEASNLWVGQWERLKEWHKVVLKDEQGLSRHR